MVLTTLTLVNLQKYCSNCSISIFCFFASVHKPWFRGPFCEAVPPQTMWPEDAFTIYLSIYLYIYIYQYDIIWRSTAMFLGMIFAFSNGCFQKFQPFPAPKSWQDFRYGFLCKIRYPPNTIHRWMMILPDKFWHGWNRNPTGPVAGHCRKVGGWDDPVSWALQRPIFFSQKLDLFATADSFESYFIVLDHVDIYIYICCIYIAYLCIVSIYLIIML